MNNYPYKIDWVGVDWGTSNLRVWGVGKDQNTVFSKNSEQGMGVLEPDKFETALLALIEPYLSKNEKTNIVCCGMVGAKTGWCEAPYISTPCSPTNASRMVLVPCKDPRIQVYILPGIRQTSPPDVMRGEETLLAGFLLNDPVFSGLVCLPGTHSKWVQIKGGKIQSFRTFMTGEIFSLIMNHSLLRQPNPNSGWDHMAFTQGLRDAMITPHMLFADLFSVRAKTLLESFPDAYARARISGLLIGQELSATKDQLGQEELILIADGKMGEIYSAAMNELGIEHTRKNAQKLALAGLSQAFQRIAG